MNFNKRIFGGDVDRLSVERAIAEFRAGRPVVVKAGGKANPTSFLTCPVDGLDQTATEALDGLAQGQARLILSGPRLRRLGVNDAPEGGALALKRIDLADMQQWTLARKAELKTPLLPLAANEAAGLKLAHLAALLPALVALPLDGESLSHLPAAQVAASAIASFSRKQDAAIRIVSRAPVPLEGAAEAEMVVFRGGEGLRDQAAVIIGAPDYARPVTIRLHSACLTGDLFGSLKCDCGDQLRMTARYMAENEGGIILYLDQEGRGNGLSNKIKAYALQSEGLDTYDADEILGFDHDQRHFDFAAAMLKQMGVTRVRVMTNNPLKLQALEEAGLDVVSQHRIHGRPTPQNIGYLAAKRDKAGHAFDQELIADGVARR